jgi:hypothetical protein
VPLVSLAALLALAWLPLTDEAPPRARPARVYTNDDLDRVAPRRGETGVLSTASPVPPAAAAEKPAARERGEPYWRRQAERVRDRADALRERARDLRLRIEERRRKPGVRPYSDPQVEALQQRLAALEARIRELESTFEDRARREGALPGWLR